MTVKYLIKSEKETINLAEKIAANIKRGDVIALDGELGSGKTFFVSSFIKYIYRKESQFSVDVTSPTFNIVKSYNTSSFTIYHFDLYRVKKVEELYELDFEDAFQNVSLIEWPKIAEGLLPESTIYINMKLIGDNEREIEIKNYDIVL
jgi:tRNA threonylcarbamoyladenosine biosynthesis protein TsaE